MKTGIFVSNRSRAPSSQKLDFGAFNFWLALISAHPLLLEKASFKTMP